MTSQDKTRVVGVYAYSEPGKVLRYQDACVVAESGDAIKIYIASLAGTRAAAMRVSKLRFGEIRDGLDSGAAYAFDREAYARFYTLARRAGIDDLAGFPQTSAEEFDLMRVELGTSSGK